MTESVQQLDSELKLHLNVNYPALEECWMDGYECAGQELEESDNPFPAGYREFDHWNEGWWAGFYGEPALYPELLSEQSQAEVDSTQEVIQAAPIQDKIKNFYFSYKSMIQNVMKIAAILAVAFVGYELADMAV